MEKSFIKRKAVASATVTNSVSETSGILQTLVPKKKNCKYLFGSFSFHLFLKKLMIWVVDGP